MQHKRKPEENTYIMMSHQMHVLLGTTGDLSSCWWRRFKTSRGGTNINTDTDSERESDDSDSDGDNSDDTWCSSVDSVLSGISEDGDEQDADATTTPGQSTKRQSSKARAGDASAGALKRRYQRHWDSFSLLFKTFVRIKGKPLPSNIQHMAGVTMGQPGPFDKPGCVLPQEDVL